MRKKCKDSTFEDRLNILYQQSGKTQTDFAKQINISRQSLGFYLSGERLPVYEHLKAIAENTSVSTDWLTGLSDVQSPLSDLQAMGAYLGISQDAIDTIAHMDKEAKAALDLILSHYGKFLSIALSPAMGDFLSDTIAQRSKRRYSHEPC